MSLDTHAPTEGVRGNPRTTVRPVTRHAPCPICKRPDWCEIDTQSGAVHCMRTESAHKSKHRGGGWWHNLPGPDEKTGRVVWSPEDFAAPGEDTRPPGADPDTRHAVYTALLALCPLSPAHRAQLLGPTRQFPQEALGNYGTLPEGTAQTPILAQLVAECGREALRETPGFVEDQSRPGGLRLNSHGGLLIPVRDVYGRIQGMQVRADRGDPRYRWLSSAEGASSGTPAHVVRPAQVTDKRVYLTEGPLKADIAARRLGAVVVGITGVTTWRAALPAMEALQAEGHDVVIVALDADDPATKARTVEQVEAIRQEIAAALVTMGYAVRFARWDHSLGKGLDDLLLDGGTFALSIHHPHVSGLAPVGDDEAPPEDTTPTGQKLRVLTQLIKNPAKRRPKGPERGDKATRFLTPTDVAVLQAAYVKASAWPVCSADQDPPADVLQRPCPVAFLASAAGVTPEAAGRSLKYLASPQLKLLTVRQDWATDPGSGTLITQTKIGGGRELGWNQELPESEHRAADRERKRRCPGCKGIHLQAYTLLCADCGEVSTVKEAEKAAADYERSVYEAAQNGAPPAAEADMRIPHVGEQETPAARVDDPEPEQPQDWAAEPEEPAHVTSVASEPTTQAPPYADSAPPLPFNRESAESACRGTAARAPASVVAGLILGLEAAPDVPALEWERRMQTTAQTARYHGLSAEERAQVDSAYQTRREALQGKEPPREAGRQSGAWAVA